VKTLRNAPCLGYRDVPLAAHPLTPINDDVQRADGKTLLVMILLLENDFTRVEWRADIVFGKNVGGLDAWRW